MLMSYGTGSKQAGNLARVDGWGIALRVKHDRIGFHVGITDGTQDSSTVNIILLAGNFYVYRKKVF